MIYLKLKIKYFRFILNMKCKYKKLKHKPFHGFKIKLIFMLKIWIKIKKKLIITIILYLHIPKMI